MENNMWWGYLHTAGTLQVKKYFGEMDITEALESPFCKIVVGPFEAKDREEASVEVEFRINK